MGDDADAAAAAGDQRERLELRRKEAVSARGCLILLRGLLLASL